MPKIISRGQGPTNQNPVGIIQREILRQLKRKKTVTADDIHKTLEVPRELGRCMAHAFRGLQLQGLIRNIAITNSSRENQNGNRIAIWELNE
jgi:hypothetical protein